jgi:hypothetical protein
MRISAAASEAHGSSTTSKTSPKRDLAVALSLVNVAFLRVWSEILTYGRPDTYLMKTPPPPAAYYAAITDVLIGAVVLWGAVTAARRYLAPSWFRWVRMAFLVSLAVPLNAIRSVLSVDFKYLRSPLFEVVGTRGVLLIAIVLGAVVVWLIVLHYRPASHIAAGVVAFFLPLVALTFGQAVWKAVHYDDSEFRVRLAPLIPTARELPRVLWIICDEWDYSLTFEDRDPSLSLPQIDRLRGETLFASNAHPPGPETPISIPGYVTGRLVDDVSYRGPYHLEIRYRDADRPWFSLAREPNVFGRVRALGLNTAVVGWFHPYCGLFQNDLVSCEWWEMAMQHNSMGRTFRAALAGEAESLFETTLLSPFGQSLALKEHIATYRSVVAAAQAIVNNRQFQFTYVHLPVPHAPFGYSRKTGRFDLSNSPVKGYIDSLALLDRTLGELRQSMESARTWDDTSVLITTDHPFREAELIHGKFDPRIPFFFKLAGQHQGLSYEAPFNTVLIQDLLLAVLRQEVTDAPGAARWLDANRSHTPLD